MTPDNNDEIDLEAVRRVNEMFPQERDTARNEFLRLRDEHGASPWTFIVISILAGLCGVLTIRVSGPYNIIFLIAVFTVVPALGLAIELARTRMELRRR